MNLLRQSYVKIKQAVIDSEMTYAQINAKNWQFVPSEVLTVDEIKQVTHYNNLVMRWLKADFRERQYTGVLKTQLFSRFDAMVAYLETQNLSELSGEEKLTRAFREWKEARNG